MVDLARLQDTIGVPGLERFRERIRKRIERGNLSGKLVLSEPLPAERDALGKLIGRAITPCQSISIDLAQLDRLLRDSGMCAGLYEALVELTGPISNKQQARALEAARWKETFQEIERQCAPFVTLKSCFADLRDSGLLRRLSRNDPANALTLMKQTVLIAEQIPNDGVPIAELAANVTGDSHALDRGRPLNTIVLKLAARLSGLELTSGAENRRDILMSAGIICDELSGPVLVLNLPAECSGITGRMMLMCSDAGEPLWLTYRQLRHNPPTFGPQIRDSTVYICENPTTVGAAANRVGKMSAPLICIDGQPKTASRLLLRLLLAAGAKLAFHGDFDWPGIQIGNLMVREFAATPWRFSSENYTPEVDGLSLKGEPVVAIWDSILKDKMIAGGKAVYEEKLLSGLLSDLDKSH